MWYEIICFVGMFMFASFCLYAICMCSIVETRLSGLAVLIMLVVAIIGFFAIVRSSESASFFIERVKVDSVSYGVGSKDVVFVRDGKTSRLKSSECEFVIVKKENQIPGDVLPYYDLKQEKAQHAIKFFGYKCYSDMQTENKYTFYVAEDSFKNLDFYEND